MDSWDINLCVGEVPRVDTELTNRHIRPQLGRVVVEMLPPLSQIGSLYVSDYGSEGLRPHVGRVLADAWVSQWGDDYLAFEHGDLAIVAGHPRDYRSGTWTEKACFGPYEAKEQVRTYGATVRTDGVVEVVPWDECCFGVYMPESDLKVVPKGRNYLLRREKVVDKSEGGVLLTDRSQFRSPTAVVAARGELATFAEVGETVMYKPKPATPIRWLKLAGYLDADYCLIHENALECVVGN